VGKENSALYNTEIRSEIIHWARGGLWHQRNTEEPNVYAYTAEKAAQKKGNKATSVSPQSLQEGGRGHPCRATKFAQGWENSCSGSEVGERMEGEDSMRAWPIDLGKTGGFDAGVV